MILGIDPGPNESGLALCDLEGTWGFEMKENEDVVSIILGIPNVRKVIVAIEEIQGYGMAVAQETFDTCRWTGEFRRAAIMAGHTAVFVRRRQVRMALCNHPKAKDPNIRQAIIDRFGGSRSAALGTKKRPGPLYGCSGHCWSALAVALVAADQGGVSVTIEQDI